MLSKVLSTLSKEVFSLLLGINTLSALRVSFLPSLRYNLSTLYLPTMRESASIPDLSHKKRAMPITTKDINVFRNSTWTAWAENIALAFIITLTFYSLLPVNIPYPLEKKLIIAQGSTSKSIIAQLNKSGYDMGYVDYFMLSTLRKNRQYTLKESEVKFNSPSLNRMDFLYKLTRAMTPIIKVDLFKITLIPGETKEIFLTQVAKKLDVNETKLFEAYNIYAKYPEAAIFSDTYLVPKQMNEEKLMKFLLVSSERTYSKLSIQAFDDYNQSRWHRILTIASIIQKEAANNKEMPLVASVIYNRLKKNMRLQMDGTLNYGKYSHIKVTPERIKNDLSSFNTYKHRGLPDSPIGSVGKHAIKAAISPAKTDYLYFMRNKKGVHDFTNTFKKHRKNIRKVK